MPPDSARSPQARLWPSPSYCSSGPPSQRQIAQRQQRSVRTEQRPRRFGERWKAVGGNIVRDAEILARQAIQKIARNRFARRKTDGMDQTLQAIPVFLQ